MSVRIAVRKSLPKLVYSPDGLNDLLFGDSLRRDVFAMPLIKVFFQRKNRGHDFIYSVH